jgi:hypothetical protein
MAHPSFIARFANYIGRDVNSIIAPFTSNVPFQVSLYEIESLATKKLAHPHTPDVLARQFSGIRAESALRHD